MRRLALLALLPAIVLLAVPATSSADPCATDLEVAGIPVTGSDCEDGDNGEIVIDEPRLLSSEAVELSGKSILSLDRGSMRPEQVVVPQLASVRRSDGTRAEFILGNIEVGTFEVCELFNTNADFGGNAFGSGAPTVIGEPIATLDRLDIHATQADCTQRPALKVTQPQAKIAARLLNLGLDLQNAIFRVGENGVSVSLPNTYGLGEERGGRVFGNFNASVPLGAERKMRLGLTVELSKDEGLKPVSLGGAYEGKVSVLPGVNLWQPAFVIDPTNQRYGGRLRIGLPLKVMVGGAELLIEQGDLKRIGVDIGLPPPGIPVGQPPFMSIQSVGATFVRGSNSTNGPAGNSVRSPAAFLGRMSLVAGPIIPIGNQGFSALVGDLDMTIKGPMIQLVGTLTAINQLIELSQVRALVAANPFRFEFDAKVSYAIPQTQLEVFKGFAFFGATANAFTGLGTVAVVIPESIPIIGGTNLGGMNGVVSNKAMAGVVTVDPPIGKPRSLGVAYKFNGGFDIINSISPFITLTPTRTITANASQSRLRPIRFRVRSTKRDATILVSGRRSKPSAVTIRRGRRKLKTVALPAVGKLVRGYAVKTLRRGRYTVTGRGISRVQVAETDEAPFLDPRPGPGTRPQGPVTAGTPVQVCWSIKNAPRGAVVDLFEDTNGSQGTGRDIATGLPRTGCHSIPTADWEPGRHWAYGVVRVGDAPLSARYWPIGINIVDPARLAPPTALQVTPTNDGADLLWQKVAGASGYIVTAFPSNPQDAPVHREVVVEDEAVQPHAELSLRGADRWDVSVQAVDVNGVLGNATEDVQTGATNPVVLAGTPNGTAQVGQPWAFKLKTANLASLRVLNAPPGTRLDAAQGLLTWTPSAAAGKAEPQLLKVEGCSADNRCVTQEWQLSAYARGLAPAGPARGFEVLDSVVRPGRKLLLRAQGVDQAVTVEIDGQRVRAKVLDQQTVEARLPRRLAKGAHDVSLQIGQDLKETLSGAIVVL